MNSWFKISSVIRVAHLILLIQQVAVLSLFISFHIFFFTIKTPNQDNIIMDYAPKDVEIDTNDGQHVMAIKENAIPFFTNSFIEKMFGKIPNLHISKLFNNSIWLAQIPMTFILSYFLGMLCRYFPTHWMSLSRGNIGDEIWPLMQTSMNYIDLAYPQMIMEFIEASSKE